VAPPHPAFPLAAVPHLAEDAAQRAAEQLRSFSLLLHKVGSLKFLFLILRTRFYFKIKIVSPF
jgi:hypothetical protein